MNRQDPSIFSFKQFSIVQEHSTMKVNTDAILLGSWADFSSDISILDIGAGTGIITLMAAQRAKSATVVGVEIEESAFEEATINAKNSPFSNRLTIVQGSIQDYSKLAKDKFSHIVSNPPFFTGGTFSSNENKATVRHAIKLPHGDLLNAVNKLLENKGRFSVILPTIEGYRFIELAERTGLFANRIAEVRPKPTKNIERLLITFSRESLPLIKENITVQTHELNVYHEDYITLTKEFYLYF